MGWGVVDKYISGGDKLERELNKIAVALKSGGTVHVGFLQNATYPNGTNVATIAAIQNFGAPSRGIPPRPFFSNMVAKHSGDWPSAVKSLITIHNYDARIVLELMGQGIAGQLRQSIIDTNDPPNAPSTIRRKGSSKPLVDTGHMLASVDYEVDVK